MKIDLLFTDIIRLKALIEREIERNKGLISICRLNLHRDINEDLQGENEKTIELCKTEIAALEEILEKIDID